MFENAEIGQSLDHESYSQLVPELRARLLDAQFRLKTADFSVVVVIAGVEGAGKGETVNVLMEWLDPRDIAVYALGPTAPGDLEHPGLHRFWRQLPPKGKTAIFFGSWYTRPIVNYVMRRGGRAQFERELTRIIEFERMLAGEGVLVLKFWLHISKKQQRRRLEKLASKARTAWRVTRDDWKFHKQYDRFRLVCSQALQRTSTAHAPWEIVEATDRRFRHVTVAGRIASAFEAMLNKQHPAPPAASPSEPPADSAASAKNLINTLDLSLRIESEEYEKLLVKYQSKLGQMGRKLTQSKRAVVVVFEGPDAAGKGGCIRRIAQALDARFYRVVPIAAPSDEEQARPYLWRFWRNLPDRGHFTIYDRSWYGRVLVERVEGLCRPEDWQRAYAEIGSFEDQMAESGIIVVKFWLAISADEQLRRFHERERTGYKRYKITDEDYRNRDKWSAYEAAACDMFARTSTEAAPWTLVESDDKHYARIKVLRTLVKRLQACM